MGPKKDGESEGMDMESEDMGVECGEEGVPLGIPSGTEIIQQKQNPAWRVRPPLWKDTRG